MGFFVIRRMHMKWVKQLNWCYSRLPLNPYRSVTTPSYGLQGSMGYERSILV
ncbi:hypothetical protein BD410DRAFT_785185 [Rickenella mellea]|uniref:Uncharacterized protein n=1 Tax=Rickenella mellea TaxID=50990 RepID=A0A4Y7QDX4_9AGAM|nr:hypothetical protein BD410DRAFT_785185 [Rickenella mellea]